MDLDKDLVKSELKFSLLTAALSLIVYLAVMIPLEFLLTERFLVVPMLSNEFKTAMLLICFSLVFVVNYFWQRFFEFLSKGKTWLVVVGLLIASLIGNKFYSDYYAKLQQYPKIFKLSQDWSIQGSRVTIEGKNFGQPHEQGEVWVGDVEFVIKKWNDEKIVAEQPVLGDYFRDQLRVIDADGKQSNQVGFIIRDAGEIY